MVERDRARFEWPSFQSGQWFSWLFGAALLSALVIICLHSTEEREFLRLAERAKPFWILVAVILQAGTYFSQGEIWRTFARTLHLPISVWSAAKLSLAKLFVDQALPTSGLSGSILIGRAMEQQGMSRSAVVGGVLLNTASFCASYTIGLIALLLITQEVSIAVRAVSFAFTIIGAILTAVILWIPGRKIPETFAKKFRFLQKAFSFIQKADPKLVRRRQLFFCSTALQILTIFLDFATLWVLIKSLGSTASAEGVFSSFMFASLIRSAGIIPGGLGTFEAASVWTLNAAGVSVSVSLASTLLFRGLSFWLPMLPGFWISRKIVWKAS